MFHIQNKFIKTAKLKPYLDNIDKLMASESLHPETISYLKALKANALFLKSLEEANAIFKETSRPLNTSLANQYDLIRAVYCFNNRDEKNCKGVLEYYKQKNPKQYQSFLRIYKITYTDEKIENIESYYPYNTRKKFLNIVNLETLIRYYDKQNDIETKNKYCKLLLPLCEEYTETYNKIKAMLGE